MYNSSFPIVASVTFIAFLIKGTTGFGTALIMIPLNALVIGVREAIVLSAILDMLGGMILFYKNPLRNSRRFWMPLALGMIIGAVTGGIVLTLVSVDGFDRVLGTVVLFLGLWFISEKGGKDDARLSHILPVSCTPVDVGVSVFSGFCGGLFGISGPPIVFYLGRRLAKEAFRGTLIAIFLFSGLARFMTYFATGLVEHSVIYLALCSIPTMLIGLYAGNHLFKRIPEKRFKRLIGCVLILAALQLLYK